MGSMSKRAFTGSISRTGLKSVERRGFGARMSDDVFIFICCVFGFAIVISAYNIGHIKGANEAFNLCRKMFKEEFEKIKRR